MESTSKRMATTCVSQIGSVFFEVGSPKFVFFLLVTLAKQPTCGTLKKDIPKKELVPFGLLVFFGFPLSTKQKRGFPPCCKTSLWQPTTIQPFKTVAMQKGGGWLIALW